MLPQAQQQADELLLAVGLCLFEKLVQMCLDGVLAQVQLPGRILQRLAAQQFLRHPAFAGAYAVHTAQQCSIEHKRGLRVGEKNDGHRLQWATPSSVLLCQRHRLHHPFALRRGVRNA